MYHSADLPVLPLFVYGTLRPGEVNYSRFLAGRTCLEQAAYINGSLYYVPGEDYPYLLIPGSGRVRGELLTLAGCAYAATLQDIDRLEDYDPLQEGTSLYLRRNHSVICNGEEVPAWVYLWNGREKPGIRLPEGDFRMRKSAPRQLLTGNKV